MRSTRTLQVTCSTKIRQRKATTTDMYAALDLGQRTIRAVLKGQDGKIVKNKETCRQCTEISNVLM